MAALRHSIPLTVALVAGLGIYFSRGVLDVVELDGHAVRLALLPGWSTLLTWMVAGALAVAGIGWLNNRRHGTLPLADLVRPMAALSVLALPYVPDLPDRLPALQALAGPLAGIVWLAAAGLQIWVLARAGLIPVPAIDRWPTRRIAVAIFAVTLAIAGLVAWRLSASPAFPGGDEPHYLVIAQSIWRDGDLDIFNNHQRGDYYEYAHVRLEPHYLKAGVDGGVYSVHPVLMPLLMAPVYAAGGYGGVVATLVVIASLAAALAWYWVRRAANSVGAATFAWAAIVGSAPFLLNTFTVYPETCAALAATAAFVLAVTVPERPGVGRYLAIGLACAVLPWLSTKYSPMSAALVAVALGRLYRHNTASVVRSPAAWAMTSLYGLSLLAWFWFFYVYWGTPSPTAPYGEHGQTSPINVLRGVPGLLFDQEYGLLAFGPVYVLAATGLATMWRQRGELRRQAVEIVIVFGALLATVGAFWIWWGGSAAPGRPIVSGLLLLALPIAVAFKQAPAGSARRASHYLLLLVGMGIATTLTVAQNGLLIDNGRDGTAALLEYWLPTWELWSLAPAYTFHDPPLTYLHTLCWLAIAAIAAAVLSRRRSTLPGANALAAVTVLGLALLTAAIVMPWLPSGPSRPAIDLAARFQLTALNGFDAGARPAAVIYDPLRVVAPAEVLPMLTVGVAPASRTDRSPIRLIHNGRFSLPAGAYEVSARFAREAPASTLGLQVGRLGGPLQQWDVLPRAGETWRAAFRLPVDANFVGFVGSPELEQAIAGLTIAATAVVDASVRPVTNEVLSARQYEGATLFFHDENLYPERQGMWSRGGRVARVTLVPAPGRTTPNVFRINSGSFGNTATLSSTSSSWRVERALVPGQVADVELPPTMRGVIPLTIRATGSYRPRDVDQASRDPRVLGIWLEFTP